jgi:oligosaccharyl transferase (archaeosortase A-associated)
MKRLKIETIACAVILALIFVLSLTLRIAVPWDHVFTAQWIKFTDNDAYFYMRLLDNLSAHFPQLGGLDPYFLYPSGASLAGQRLFFVDFMGFFTWLFGGAAPSQQIVDTVGVFFPAALGALLVFPVFFIGRAIFNKWAGLVASLFIALIPGEFLVRTLLGNTDIHVLEIFLSTFFILFLILAAQCFKNIDFCDRAARPRLIKPGIYSLIAGLLLGLYLLSWQGALFFVLISFLWFVLQATVNHLRGLTSWYLALTGAVVYLVALLVSLALPAAGTILVSVGIAALAAVALPLLSWLMQKRKLQPGYYPAAVVALGLLGVLGIYLVNTPLLSTMYKLMAGFFVWNPASTIAETQPLLINQGTFTLALVWGNYTAGSILALVGLAVVVYRVIKEGTDGITLLAVWSIMTLLAALALRRFAYYFAVDVALLSGYTGWLILRVSGWKDAPAEAASPITSVKKKARGKAARQKAQSPSGMSALTILGIAAVAFLAVYPNTGPLPGGDRPFFDVATKALYAPSNAWYETLDWMRKNTPEPFGDPQYYYRDYRQGPASSSGNTGYGVLCWWDYGYWVTRIAHRVPLSNPGTAQLGEQYFFMAQDTQQAAKTVPLSRVKYVLVDDNLVNWNGGFPTVASDAQESASKFYEIYYRQQSGSVSPTLLYYPEYYQTMAVRLFCFEGKKFTPQETAVISWETKTGADGRPYREITALKTTHNYTEAAAFVSSQTSGNWRIVGKDPNVSPVPLDELQDFHLVYGSSQKAKIGTADTSQVKLFEYTAPAK